MLWICNIYTYIYIYIYIRYIYIYLYTALCIFISICIHYRYIICDISIIHVVSSKCGLLIWHEPEQNCCFYIRHWTKAMNNILFHRIYVLETDIHSKNVSWYDMIGLLMIHLQQTSQSIFHAFDTCRRSAIKKHLGDEGARCSQKPRVHQLFHAVSRLVLKVAHLPTEVYDGFLLSLTWGVSLDAALLSKKVYFSSGPKNIL